jgi:hypothetical protein
MLETVVVAAIVLAAFGLVFRSFYRSFTGKEDDGLYGGTCSDACGNCRRDCCQQTPYPESKKKENRTT